ncbi:MAG: DUF2630 family protein [Nitriliruptorales bacterium]|nr:DUF2630 family protein [Nitriliruptorales bacterium]
MDDEDILGRIQKLVAEEDALRSTEQPVPPQRLESLEVMLDQCWDLLRQRRARREFGEPAEGASPRPADVVEGYQQ